MIATRLIPSLRRASGLVLLASIGFSAVSVAHAEKGTPEQRAACTTDAFRFCASSIPNVAAITSCMVTNKAKLSVACRATFPKKTASR